MNVLKVDEIKSSYHHIFNQQMMDIDILNTLLLIKWKFLTSHHLDPHHLLLVLLLFITIYLHTTNIGASSNRIIYDKYNDLIFIIPSYWHIIYKNVGKNVGNKVGDNGGQSAGNKDKDDGLKLDVHGGQRGGTKDEDNKVNIGDDGGGYVKKDVDIDLNIGSHGGSGGGTKDGVKLKSAAIAGKGNGDELNWEKLKSAAIAGKGNKDELNWDKLKFIGITGKGNGDELNWDKLKPAAITGKGNKDELNVDCGGNKLLDLNKQKTATSEPNSFNLDGVDDDDDDKYIIYNIYGAVHCKWYDLAGIADDGLAVKIYEHYANIFIYRLFMYWTFIMISYAHYGGNQ